MWYCSRSVVRLLPPATTYATPGTATTLYYNTTIVLYTILYLYLYLYTILITRIIYHTFTTCTLTLEPNFTLEKL